MQTESQGSTLSYYQQGYDAGVSGQSNSNNPYEKDTQPFDDWLDGWVDGRTALHREITGQPPIQPGEYYY